jgi:hypothetical protein
MSTTATSFDLKQLLVERVRRIGKSYLSDLSFIPEDKLGVSPMGKARSPIEFTAECAGFNLWVARTFRNEPDDAAKKETRAAYLASLVTAPLATRAFEESIEVLATAIAETPDEELFREITMPWGSAAPLHEAAAMATAHMMYHDGQINYIQSLYGDDDNHWG